MKPTHNDAVVYGLETQQFVPVQNATGILVSSGSVRVTGAQTEVAVVEVRNTPDRTVAAPSYFEPASQSKTGMIR